MTERRRRQLEKHIAGLEKVRAQYVTVLEADEREGKTLRAEQTKSRLWKIDRLLERARRELEELSG